MEGSIDEGIEVERSREKAGEVAEERTQGNQPVARAMNIERYEPCAGAHRGNGSVCSETNESEVTRELVESSWRVVGMFDNSI
jgi:hypothetical protein